MMHARDSYLHVVCIVRSRFCWHRSDEYFALLLFFYLRFGLRSLERGGEGERDSDGDLFLLLLLLRDLDASASDVAFWLWWY
jgi:hypothetical protein